jgi:uncharacterized protein involved in exopolysaccharide biosynthesis
VTSPQGEGTRLSALTSTVLGREFRDTVVLAFAAGVLAALVSLFLPKSYRADARILPSASGPGNSSLLQLAASSGLTGLLPTQIGAAENPTLTYPEILLSRTVLQRILSSPYPPSLADGGSVLEALRVKGKKLRYRMDSGVRTMRRVVSVRANPRSGIIAVAAVTQDSLLSAFIVGRLLSELNQFNVESRSSRGRAAREFLEERMNEARQELLQAEQALVNFRAANLRIGNSPQLLLDQARYEREVSVRSELYQFLARQFELARIEEKRDTPTFSIIDSPYTPVRKSQPTTTLNAFLAALTAVALRLLLKFLHQPRAQGSIPRDEPAALI